MRQGAITLCLVVKNERQTLKKCAGKAFHLFDGHQFRFHFRAAAVETSLMAGIEEIGLNFEGMDLPQAMGDIARCHFQMMASNHDLPPIAP